MHDIIHASKVFEDHVTRMRKHRPMVARGTALDESGGGGGGGGGSSSKTKFTPLAKRAGEGGARAVVYDFVPDHSMLAIGDESTDSWASQRSISGACVCMCMHIYIM